MTQHTRAEQTLAERAFGEAALALARADAELEAAHGTGDSERKRLAHERVCAALDAHSTALKALVAEYGQTVPSFEDMLRDPTSQPDPVGAVLKSIEAYRNAKPATAGLPVDPNRKQP